MHLTAPSPEGATMSYPSELAPYPTISAYIFAPLALACSYSSKTIIPPPPAITNPSLSESYARLARCGVLLYLDDIAPIASNKDDKDQSNSSPPPAKTISCIPYLMASVPAEMQCAEVEQAEVME